MAIDGLADGGIRGTKPLVHLQDEALRVIAGRVGRTYDAWETSVGIVTDENMRTRAGSLLFLNVPRAHRCIIRSDKAISVKFNATTNPAITLDPFDPLEADWLEVTELFVTTTQAANALRIILV
jgi:hypothetical protein